MSRHPLTLALLLILYTAAFAQTVPNRVKNPGFEQVQADLPVGWTLSVGAGLDNAQFYAGAMGLKLDNKAAGTSTATQIVQCGQEQYVALCWVRTEKVVGTGARLRVLGGSGQFIGESKPVTGDAAWQRLVAPFNPGNNVQVTVELSLAQATGAAWFDDVIVTDANSAKPLLQTEQAGPQRENLALGKPYELSPPPSYAYCTDPDDVTQLTDGQYTVGYFWTQKSSVGWYLFSPQITVDLGRVEPISGIMINTPGGGAAGVQFPQDITYLVSDDNVRFYEVARLTPKGLKQDGKSWYTHKFLADNLHTRGRYVMIRINKAGSTAFADEIEVYKGDFDPATVKFTGQPRDREEMAFGQYALSPTTYTRGHFPETPHVKWAIPLAGGPIKAIVMAYSEDMRDVCELAQRLDLDYVPVSTFSYYRPEPLGSLMQEQIQKALPTCRVMVVGGFRWEAVPKPLLEQIKARVREGMGLVSVCSATVFNKDIEDIFKETPLTGEQGILDLVPMSLIPAYQKPKGAHLRLAQYGQGRVAWLDPGWYTKQAHSLWPYYGMEAIDDDALNGSEYQWVTLARTVLWASVRDARKIEKLAATPERVSVTVGPLAQPAKLQGVVRGTFFEPLQIFEAEVPAAGLTREFAIPPTTNGPHAVDVWVRDAAGKIVDFGSTSFTTAGDTGIESLALDQRCYAPLQPVLVDVKLQGDTQGARLQTQLVDTFGRWLAPLQVTPVTGPKMRLTVPVSQPLSLEADLFITLLRGDRVIEQRVQRVWLDRPESDDYTFMAWYSWEQQPKAYYGGALLRQFGLDGYVSLPAVTRAENAAYANLRHGPENVSRVAPENRDESRVRVPCLTDPAFLSKTAERIEKLAEDTRPYGVTEWSMGDESTLGRRDYCTSPTCLAAFRAYLKQQYPSLEALNASWGSSFATWEDVVPATLAEVEKKPSIGAWLEHRRYMESLFASYHDWCKNLVVKHIPAARVGISGTPNVNSYSGHDWWKLMQGPLTHLSSYGGVQREMQRSFALPGTFVSTFLGYDYKDNDEQRARYAPWDLVFHGSNGVNYYTLMSDTLNCPLIRPDMTLTNKAPWYFEEVKQLKDGFGRLFMAGRYVNDGIAVHYSPASVHAATAAGLFDNRDRLRRYDNNLSNLNMILKQLHLQYNFVHEEQMAKGELRKYRVLILPWSSAISEREAAAIREFAQNGGTVIADSFCGVRDDHGKPQAMLDDLFGVKQTLTPPELQSKELMALVGDAHEGIIVASGSPELQLAGGKATLRIGETPALIVNKVGKGQGVFLNFSFSNYAEVSAGGVAGETLEEEVAPEKITAPIRKFVAAMLAGAGVSPAVKVACDEQQDAQVEVSRLNLDQTTLLGVARAITAGAVDPQDALACKLTLPAAAHVYDSRSGKYFGQISAIDDKLVRGLPKVYAALRYPVQSVTVSAPATVATGQPLSLNLAVLTAPAKVAPGTHVLHVAVTGPDGKERAWYGQNVVAAAGKATIAVPLAFNDAPGKWTITATDMATHTSGKLEVTVTK